MFDSDWLELFMALREEDTICRAIHLVLKSEVDENQLTSIQTLLDDNQFRLTNLIVTVPDYLLNVSIQRDFFRQLKENHSIIDLELHFKLDSNIFDEFIDLLTTKTNFIRLSLPDSWKISDREAIMLGQALRNNTVLQSLIMTHSEISDIGFEALLSSLSKSLHQLIIKNNQITAKSLPSLSAFINDRPALKHVCLTENHIRGNNNSNEVNVFELTEKMVKIAYANQCILDLGVNDQVTSAMIKSADDRICTFFCRSFQDHDILGLHYELKKISNRNCSLDLRRNNEISSVDYRYFADILSSTMNISELIATNNNMNEETRATFLDGLWRNQTLKKVIIQENQFSSDDMKYIGRFIENNSMLKEMDLQACEINDDGASHLAQSLLKSRLEILDLSRNSISDRGCASLLSSISPTLLNLSLSGNEITKLSLQMILTFLANNRTLQKLRIGNNPIVEETIYEEQIKEIAKQNHICEID